LVTAALGAPDPAVVVLAAADTGALAADHPAFGKTAGSSGAVAFVCRRSVCGLPVSDPAELARMLRSRV
jgi:uncharacterized protein